MACLEFDEALLEAADFAFRSLGPSTQQALYFHLKRTFHLSRKRIPTRIEEFDEALRLIFKDGAIFLEKLILKKLCEELKVRFDETDVLDFVGSISRIRHRSTQDVTLTTGFETVFTMAKEESV